MKEQETKLFHLEVEKEILKIFSTENKVEINIDYLISKLNKIEYFKKKRKIKSKIFNIIKSNKIKRIKIKGSRLDYKIYLFEGLEVLNTDIDIKKKDLFQIILLNLMLLILVSPIYNFLISTKFNSFIESSKKDFKKLQRKIKRTPSLTRIMASEMNLNIISLIIIIICIIVSLLIKIKNIFVIHLDNLPRAFYENEIVNIYTVIFIFLLLLIFSIKDKKIHVLPNINIIAVLFSFSCFLSFLLKKYLKIQVLSSSNIYQDFFDIYSIVIFMYFIIILKNLDTIIIILFNLLKKMIFFFLPIIFIYNTEIFSSVKNAILDIYNLLLRIIINLDIVDLKITPNFHMSFLPYSTEIEKEPAWFLISQDVFFILLQLSIVIIYLSFINFTYLIIKHYCDNYCNKNILFLNNKIESFISRLFCIILTGSIEFDKSKKYFSYKEFSYKNKIIKTISVFTVFITLIWLLVSDEFFKDLYYAFYTEKNNGYCLNVNNNVYMIKKDSRVLIDSKYLTEKETPQEFKYKIDKEKKDRFFYYRCDFNEGYND